MTGEELKTIRKELGFSQQALSKEFGVSARQIVNLEKGLTPIKEIYIEKISLLKMKLEAQKNMKNHMDDLENLDMSEKEYDGLVAYRELDDDEQDIFYYELKAAAAKKRKRLKETSLLS
ncbi:MAG: hypothetical protein A2513_10890 [Sulfurimonas sp. RIFOXYD12_FULL_33_39]|uniref:helix-turn-helix domain-containing protein n=1 Tax=unclassified Sulfurimonas TaxID=2623549 RepID=UPI0008ADF95C|nr:MULTISPECIES: helix-turn-helix transcriptional regulator [unclassified Sulfurimonas]OHE01455.1 MAG: hypothetical protein A3G74_08900 [Sulfurimonas sp. RIFCSPLOWO2_12_FULL_34_6]OHE09812.1 MAG: hypothetical protein A2513_10890 [Sulfurimonas sp. RIFOXYD12_FULL_33_39]OHE13680.1 MAG: hypothetical protein A2530_08865 [Sulfurimonas sp. RIFOXYD2_FULL_34_21]DAB28106.1 MAG TPA: hypothetical protein CFH78_04390 [Sulfurimonas sp. UBA10385]